MDAEMPRTCSIYHFYTSLEASSARLSLQSVGYRTHPRQCKQEQNDQRAKLILDYAVLPQQPSNLQAEDSTDAAAELADQHTEVGPKRILAIWHGMRLPSNVKWRSAEKAVGENWNEETGLPCWFEEKYTAVNCD